ncbi:MAG: SsrA-binding protein SmpB [Firmicutes bacterium]|nr:SsrA-binding protein SmpB [Bacillota bacterium]
MQIAGGAGKPRYKTLARNRRARHQYFIEETMEAGIVLRGTEVKSVRLGRVNLKDSYARVEDGELFLHDMHISPYDPGNRFNHDPLRSRKLLMHRREINRLDGYIQAKGYTLVPLSVYLKGSRVKVELAVAKGKKEYDKRRAIAEKDAKREMERSFKERQFRG